MSTYTPPHTKLLLTFTKVLTAMMAMSGWLLA